MGKKTEQARIYHQKVPAVVLSLLAVSLGLTFWFFVSYAESSGVFALIFANVFLLVTIVLAKPIVEWRWLELAGGVLIVHKAFFKPIRVDIARSLFQIVMFDGDILSYRFQVGDHYVQLSPRVYRGGEDFSRRLREFIHRKRLVVEAVHR